MCSQRETDQIGQAEEVPGPLLFCSCSACADLDGVAVRTRTGLKSFMEKSPCSLSTRGSVGPQRSVRPLAMQIHLAQLVV